MYQMIMEKASSPTSSASRRKDLLCTIDGANRVLAILQGDDKVAQITVRISSDFGKKW
jgi:hypothetical protein